MEKKIIQCSCIVCKKVYSIYGIDTHYMRNHGTKEEKERFSGSAKALRKQRKERIKKYNKNPKLCNICNNPLPYKIKQNTFCSSSCSATYNNKTRSYVVTETTKQKIRKSLLSFRISKGYVQKEIVGEYTKLNRMICRVCSGQFLTPSKTTYCPSHQKFNKNRKRFLYYFRFNVYDYPDLFDLDLLKNIGFYSAGGRHKKLNIHGLSRDHRVSVDDAMLNNYDPYYISHPVNCKLMLQSENSKKHKQSSISYEDLIAKVDAYDASRGVSRQAA